MGSVAVRYLFRDGWHVFRSYELPGLYVAHQTAETAFNDVATAIEKLIRLNTGIRCQAKPQLTFAEFMAARQVVAMDDDGDGPPGWPLVRNFSLERLAA